MASHTFTNPKIPEAAARFVEGYRTPAARRRGAAEASATWSGWKCTT